MQEESESIEIRLGPFSADVHKASLVGLSRCSTF